MPQLYFQILFFCQYLVLDQLPFHLQIKKHGVYHQYFVFVLGFLQQNLQQKYFRFVLVGQIQGQKFLGSLRHLWSSHVGAFVIV